MKKFKLLSLAALVVVVALASCSKGSNGAAGATGPAGPAGPDSVLHSAWVDLNFTINSVSGTDTLYSQTVTASAITQEILDSGVVISYVGYLDKNGNTQVETPLDFNIEEVYNVGSITVYSPTDYTGLSYRYVIVPGTIVTNSALKGMSKAQIQNLSYDKLTAIVGTATTVKVN